MLRGTNPAIAALSRRAAIMGFLPGARAGAVAVALGALLHPGAARGAIEAYAWPTSVIQGQSVALYISSASDPITVEIFREGVAAVRVFNAVVQGIEVQPVSPNAWSAGAGWIPRFESPLPRPGPAAFTRCVARRDRSQAGLSSPAGRGRPRLGLAPPGPTRRHHLAGLQRLGGKEPLRTQLDQRGAPVPGFLPCVLTMNSGGRVSSRCGSCRSSGGWKGRDTPPSTARAWISKGTPGFSPTMKPSSASVTTSIGPGMRDDVPRGTSPPTEMPPFSRETYAGGKCGSPRGATA